jgi:hypothetical protein
MIDFWDEEIAGGTQRSLKVFVINDLHKQWNGTVRLRIVHGDNTVAEQTRDCTVDPLGREILTFEEEFPQQAGEYQIVGELVKVDGVVVRSLRDFKIVSVGN